MTANYNFIGFIVPHGTCTKDINYHVYSPPSTTQEQVDRGTLKHSRNTKQSGSLLE